ncbi:MAG: hypothetical protein KIS96_10430 [Bauldia sp.]|nr:hypothetical protein [Bauldia sp.]
MKTFARLGASLAAAALVPTMASAQLYIGAMPTNEQLLRHMNAIPGCVGNGGVVYEWLGKFEQSAGEWVVYFSYQEPDGSRYFDDNVIIRQLDTGVWILYCTTQDGATPSRIIEPLPVTPEEPAAVDPPAAEEKPAAPG